MGNTETIGQEISTLTFNLRPYAMRLTRDRDEAEDLLQETVLKAYSKKESFQKGTNLKAWMCTIMRNTFITQYQRRVRKHVFVNSTASDYLLSTQPQTKNKALGNMVLDDIKTSINHLKAIYKIPFIMYFRGFKYHEIAKRLSIPIGTVKNRIHLAKKELRELLHIYANYQT